MNDLPTLPDPNGAGAEPPSQPPSQPPQHPPSPPPAQPPSPPPTQLQEQVRVPAEPVTKTVVANGGDMQRPFTVALVVLFVLLAAHAWSTRNQVQKLRLEVANRLHAGENINTQTNALARTLQDQTRDLQAKVSQLENRQSEAQSQQLALEQLYQDLSKNRDEWALAEIEQVLSTASQQLQLAGNVQGALIALQNADRSLSHSDKPQFITIRRAIAKDMETLKALPSLDLAGVALRIDNVIAQVDTLPLLADERPAPFSTPERVNASGSSLASDSFGARVRDTWRQFSAEMWGDIRELIRVRTVNTPEALMLSPTQTYFLRENLKLRLLNARLALLARNEVAFRTDLNAAQDALNKYFDTGARTTQTAQALLRQVQANNLAIDMPSLSDSLNAVRNYKAKP